MLAAGFEVDATEGVSAMAQLAQARLGRSVRVMRFDELDAHEEYDAVWASASLLHVPRAELPHVISLVHRALKTDGVHCASFKTGKKEGRDRVGRYFNYPTRDGLMEAYDSAGGWHLKSLLEYEGGGYESGTGPWLAVTLRKR